MLGGVDSNTFETNNFQGLQFIQIKGNDSFGDGKNLNGANKG